MAHNYSQVKKFRIITIIKPIILKMEDTACQKH